MGGGGLRATLDFACGNPLEEVDFPEKVNYCIPKLREDIASLYQGQCIIKKQ